MNKRKPIYLGNILQNFVVFFVIVFLISGCGGPKIKPRAEMTLPENSYISDFTLINDSAEVKIMKRGNDSIFSWLERDKEPRFIEKYVPWSSRSGESNERATVKVQIDPQYGKVIESVVYDSSKSPDVVFAKNKTHYVRIRGHMFGPFPCNVPSEDEEHSAYCIGGLCDNGKNYGFMYVQKNDLYIKVNSRVFGPLSGFRRGGGAILSDYWWYRHDELSAISLSLEGNDFYFTYFDSKNHFHLRINDSVVSFSDTPHYLRLYDKCNVKYYLTRFNTDSTGDWYYFHTSDSIYGPLEPELVWKDPSTDWESFEVSDDGKSFIFAYRTPSGHHFVRVNQRVFGPFDNVKKPLISRNGKNYSYYFTKGESDGVCVNGTAMELTIGWRGEFWSYVDLNDLQPNAKWLAACYGDRSDQYLVVVNGEKMFGPFSYITYRYDREGRLIIAYRKPEQEKIEIAEVE